MKKLLLSLVLTFFTFGLLMADEGMWLPIFLKYNEAEMQSLGFKLTAEDVYSVNHHSMKDAIVLFGGGCTGELISSQGLLLTNHHCGYSQVQAHSTMEHNYLQNGFWAKNFSEEIPTPGLTVTFLIYMEDVTRQVLQDVNSNTSEKERQELVKRNIETIISKLESTTPFKAAIKPFYYGNQYFMFVTQTYRDIRLVGVPPESIGKFGGDSDNWMWPRHTGDFSLWRIYTDKNGQPADYSPDNVPMKPAKWFPISIGGVEENDFTLVFGYPGTTHQFYLSDAVDIVANVQNPIAIQARTIRLDAMKRYMNQDPRIRLMYSAKANSISNGWKKWQGESKGIRECNVVEMKQKEEQEFVRWVNANPAFKNELGNLLPEMKKLYKDYRSQVQTTTYISECLFGVEMIQKVVHPYVRTLVNGDEASFAANRDKLIDNYKRFCESYYQPIDKECFVNLMTYYFTSQEQSQIPASLHKYCSGDYCGSEAAVKVMMEQLWDKMATTAPYFTDPDKFVDFLTKANYKKVAKTAKAEVVRLYDELYKIYVSTYNESRVVEKDLDRHYRDYVSALMSKETDKVFYPDADLTMRVTYGQVNGFEPADGVRYSHYTTLDGIIAKEDPDVYDYQVDPRLKQLWEKKDYGRYANSKGELPVAFIASNHTTGGNSGSPVINANGHLIGTNFDRVWEGTMSDIHYDVNRCRNISLDARYFLFIVDKFAGAQNLIDEMTIVED
ncbi:MAG: S46 family peptidase [Bacteroidales bacterium]|nr:S46 family peptidase [Bacteroidales bacterium]